MEPHYMEWFINQNFLIRCPKDRYCFRCQLAFCSHCCPDHWAHHPPHAQRRYIAGARLSGGRVMINAADCRGLGYDWRRIQWFHFGGQRWMFLQQPHDPVPYQDYPHRCIACNEKRRSNFDFCSISCQVAYVPGANAIARATNLLAANWGQVECDFYCTRCRRAFSSALCATHIEIHHPNQVAQTIQVFHHHGWALVAANQEVLPAFVFQGVQLMEINGVGMHPIRSRPLQQQVLPVAGLMHPCAGTCVEAVPDGAQFCSIHCRLRH